VHSEVVAEFAVTLLRVEAPDFLAVEVERSEIAAADEREDELPVGAGRGGHAVVLLLAPPGTALA
jgi:hypothetical protein